MQTEDSVRRAEDLLKRGKEKGVEDSLVIAGDKLTWDPALEVEVLSPPKTPLKGKNGAIDENTNSLVLRLRHGNFVFLFTADASPSTQDHLIATYTPETLKTTVMSAPHHGKSSYAPFGKVARPEVVVVSCAKRDALEIGALAENAYRPVDAKVYVAALHGAVQIVSDGTSYTVRTERTPPLDVIPGREKGAPSKPGATSAPEIRR